MLDVRLRLVLVRAFVTCWCETLPVSVSLSFETRACVGVIKETFKRSSDSS